MICGYLGTWIPATALLCTKKQGPAASCNGTEYRSKKIFDGVNHLFSHSWFTLPMCVAHMFVCAMYNVKHHSTVILQAVKLAVY